MDDLSPVQESDANLDPPDPHTAAADVGALEVGCRPLATLIDMADVQPLRHVPASALLLTPEEAAHLLAVGRTTIYALMKAGDLQPVHIGRCCRLSRAELERYIRRLEAPASASARPGVRTRPTTRQGELFELVHTPPDVP